jgi:hypothetical protein
MAGLKGAAAKLGIPRQTLESKIKTLAINKSRFKLHNSLPLPDLTVSRLFVISNNFAAPCESPFREAQHI